MLGQEEIGKLLKSMNPALTRFSMIALLTGTRSGEIYRLR
jgi:hypothetical protein